MSPIAISSREEAHLLLQESSASLFASANSLREKYFGRSIDLCAIINARSGNCSMDCAFCSQSAAYATNIATHPLLPAHELKARIELLASLPVNHIGIVTSGALLKDEELQKLSDLFSSFPSEISSRLCTSLGRLPLPALKELKEAGIKRFHHNLESSKAFYPNISKRQSWEERRATVVAARSAGLVNCTGGLFGLGESWDDRIDFAFELRSLGIRNIPMNFLDPRPGTPLGHRPPLKGEEALRIIALFRHILPEATLRICGGRPVTFADKEELIFQAGANALMIGDYLTTAGSGPKHDLKLLERLRLHPSFEQEKTFEAHH